MLESADRASASSRADDASQATADGLGEAPFFAGAVPPWPDECRDDWAAARARIAASRHFISPAGPRPRWRTELFGLGLRLLDWTVRIMGLYGRGRRNALAPRLAELDVSFASLPAAFDGYRILHVSDSHLDALPELVAVGREALAGVEVDLVVFTGDVMAAYDVPPDIPAGLLGELLGDVPVRDRRLAILGNHDSIPAARALEEARFEVLINRSVTLHRGDERIAVTGLDDVHCFYTPAASAALVERAEAFHIALVHSPEMADRAAAAGVDFYLCGHTHGGQICLPGGRWLISRLTRCRHAVSGFWREGPTLGYTSRGLGASWPPLRYNCRGEMTLFTLRRSGQGSAEG